MITLKSVNPWTKSPMSTDLREVIKKLAGGKKLGPYG
jgi:hypothetical protein